MKLNYLKLHLDLHLWLLADAKRDSERFTEVL